MILKRKIITVAAMLICVITIALAAVTDSTAIFTQNSSQEVPCIIIDAGHGGFDGGAVAPDGTVEKDINLKISQTLSEFLRLGGYKVILTREADVSTDDVETDKISTRKKSDLKNRLKLMQDYPNAVFVSIHLNKFTTSAANGSQVFFGAKNNDSQKLGQEIQTSIVNLLQQDNKRIIKKATSSTYLLYNATIPAVIVECGFLSNKAELEKLKQEEYQQKMAFCIYCGINNYFSNIKEI